MTRILIVDDDPVQLRITAEVANRAGFRPITATGGAEALDILRSDMPVAAVVLDLVMPDVDGMAVLEAMQREGLTQPVIIQTAKASLETVITTMRHGAADFFVKPVAPERLVVSLRNALKLDALETAVRTEQARREGTIAIKDMIATAPVMQRVLALCEKAARSPIPVLIEGETGVGKELLARIIQGTGDRTGKPFVVVNCGALAPDTVEATLFGQARANGTVVPGRFAEAHGGTIFLDEIGELSLDMQAKILRVLADGTIEPIDGKSERINVRIVTATNRRLLNLARTGEFREDLYYRLNVFPIYLPPLRERREDIEPMCERFIARFSAEAGKRVLGLSDATRKLLLDYDWPGNVRQLENALYRAIVLSDGGWLEPADFPQIVAGIGGREAALRELAERPHPGVPVHIDVAGARRAAAVGQAALPPAATAAASDRFLSDGGAIKALADIERDLIAFAIEQHNGRMSAVARTLGIGRSTLYRKLAEYGLGDPDRSDAAA